MGVWYARGIDFRRFSYAKPSDFRRNFWPTRSDEDVYVVLVNIIKDRLHIYNAVDYYTSRGSCFICFVDFSKAFDRVNCELLEIGVVVKPHAG